ncbi:MAG: hypothetical protein MJ102_03910 [Clostridia bacterium]|nr:hypothetical protein [Clostridia bacterium]
MDYRDYRKKYRNTRNRGSSARKSGAPILAAIIALSVILVAGIVISIAVASDSLPDYVVGKVIAEAGSNVKPSDFLTENGHLAEFEAGASCNTGKVGTQKMKLVVDGHTHTVRVKVVDTVAPMATAVPVALPAGAKADPTQFITNVIDETPVTAKFKSKPDTSFAGTYQVVVVLTDKGGNKTEVAAPLTVIDAGNVKNAALTVELGSPLPDASAFTGGQPATYITDISAISTAFPGYYVLYISVSGMTSQVILNVTDTVAPTATVFPLKLSVDSPLPPASSFVSNIVDASPVTVSYEVTPVINSEAEQLDVVIVLTDYSGNKTKYPTYITLINDKEAPVITVLKNNIDINLGDMAISWSTAVKVTDNSDDFDYYLDSSKVNRNVAGQYPAYVIATDSCGNESRAELFVSVHAADVTEEMLNQVLDKISGQVFTSGMTKLQKSKAIFDYIWNNMAYTSDGAHNDWRREAYYGLSSRRSGDCYTFMAAAYALFRYTGIDAIIVERSPENQLLAGGTHFWLMINLGTNEAPEWYHFDSTPQRSPFRTLSSYAMTDAQINAHTKWRNDVSGKTEYYYGYDASLYPKSAEKTLVTLKIPAKYYD